MLTIENLVVEYQQRAAVSAEHGLRPIRLPCEADGKACSDKFLEKLKEGGVAQAISDMLARCPNGRSVAIQALLRSAQITLIPVSAYTNGLNELPGWDPNTEPCFQGSPAEC